MNINRLAFPTLTATYLQPITLLLSSVLLAMSMTACEGKSSGSSSETLLAPELPVNLSVAPGIDNGQVVLSWVKGVRAEKYAVYHSQTANSASDRTVVSDINKTHYNDQ